MKKSKNILAKYRNGNYEVTLYEDGTKIKETDEDRFISSFPDSIDLKITNYCDNNCPYCHEKSSVKGKIGDLSIRFLDLLPSGIELAIGGGNPLSHPDLTTFLKRMKEKGIICNITINQKHLLENIDLVQNLIDKKLIYGLGVSINKANENVIEFANKNSNVVLHLIAGIFEEYTKLFNKNLKILILGYKNFGRGAKYYNHEIDNKILLLKTVLPRIINKFKIISFDNLAIQQLNVENIMSKKEYDSIFMGNDGEASMYINLVKKEYSVSSISTKRYKIKDNLIDMFNTINKSL